MLTLIRVFMAVARVSRCPETSPGKLAVYQQYHEVPWLREFHRTRQGNHLRPFEPGRQARPHRLRRQDSASVGRQYERGVAPLLGTHGLGQLRSLQPGRQEGAVR